MKWPSSRCRSSSGKKRFPASSRDRKSTRLNSSHLVISYAVFCLKKKKPHRNKRRLHFIHSETSNSEFHFQQSRHSCIHIEHNIHSSRTTRSHEHQQTRDRLRMQT